VCVFVFLNIYISCVHTRTIFTTNKQINYSLRSRRSPHPGCNMKVVTAMKERRQQGTTRFTT